jgi:hypothetical protein
MLSLSFVSLSVHRTWNKIGMSEQQPQKQIVDIMNGRQGSVVLSEVAEGQNHLLQFNPTQTEF